MINIIGGVIVGCILALVGKQCMDESNEEIA